MTPCNKVNFFHENDVDTVIYNMRQEGNIFNMSTEELAKNFLNKCLCDDFFVNPFYKMRDDYIEATHKDQDEAPNNLGEFCTYILRTHFRYWQEPKQVLLEYYERATKDWNELDIRIKKIDNEIILLKKANHPTTNQERLPLLYFYLKHTRIALDEVIDFLKKDIHDFVLRKCAMPANAIFQDSYPYHYYVAATAFNIKQPSMISNKFTLSDNRNEIIDMYDNRQEDFKIFLRNYIEENDVLSIIKQAFDTNYFFYKRNELIKEALEIYENRKYILFSSACFLIVEGILHDICLQLGIPDNDILGAGFQEKINKIHENYNINIDYQYYSFKFRLLRNEVVHGTAKPEELREIADLLLLDLVDMIEITKSNRILFNAKLLFLKAGLQKSADRFEYIAGYIILSDIKIPYSNQYLSESHDVILSILQEEVFWNYVDKLCDSKFSYDRAIGIQVLKKICSLEIATLNEKCSTRLRKHKGVKDKFDLNTYLKGVLQYTF
jgi:hypothetical protein